MKGIKQIFGGLIFGLMFLAVVCLYCENRQLKHQLVEQQTSLDVPTIRQIQAMLVNAGYDIGSSGIDGKLGNATKKAWDLAICQQSANKYNYYYDAK